MNPRRRRNPTRSEPGSRSARPSQGSRWLQSKSSLPRDLTMIDSGLGEPVTIDMDDVGRTTTAPVRRVAETPTRQLRLVRTPLEDRDVATVWDDPALRKSPLAPLAGALAGLALVVGLLVIGIWSLRQPTPLSSEQARPDDQARSAETTSPTAPPTSVAPTSDTTAPTRSTTTSTARPTTTIAEAAVPRATIAPATPALPTTASTTSAPPTTVAPTTVPSPTTLPATTAPPTTPPTVPPTSVPTTIPPTTAAPTTVAPTTAPPTTATPTTATPTTAPSTTVPPTTVPPTVPSTPIPSSVTSPDQNAWPTNRQVFGADVDDVVALLEARELVVTVASVGCSESTAAGAVRQVTIGSALNVNIVYGKPTDAIVGPGQLREGTSVTVWTPRNFGC